MQKMVVAKVNAYVRESAAHRIEKYQVTRLELIGVDLLADFTHFSSSAWQAGTDTVLEYQTHKTAAIKPAAFVIATETVANANQLQSLQDDILRSVGVTFKK